jgi:hypothetical protein
MAIQSAERLTTVSSKEAVVFYYQVLHC